MENSQSDFIVFVVDFSFFSIFKLWPRQQRDCELSPKLRTENYFTTQFLD